MRTLYNLAMFFIAPFIGLFYIFALPALCVTLLMYYTIVHFLPNSWKEVIRELGGEGAIDPFVWVK